MKIVKGKVIAVNAVLQKTDKYGKSVEHALESGEDGLYLVDKNGSLYSIYKAVITIEEPIIIKKVEQVVKETVKPKIVKRSFRKKK